MPLVEDVKEARGATSAAVDKVTGEAYWKKTSSLMWVVMGLWAFFGFGVHFFAGSLNSIHILGFPMGFYMAAQGSLIVFVVQLFWFAKAQDMVDRKYGMAEDD